MAKENKKDPKDQQVVVIGLGRFGSATALTLVEQHREVLAIERNPELVQQYASELTYVVAGDTTNIDVLKELGVEEFSTAVVGVGTSIEASVLTCANLVDLGISNIWAKAISSAHGKILERIGATHVIYPEADAGDRIAHLIAGHLLDFIEFEDDFAIVKMRSPKKTWNKTLLESRIRSRYNVTIVGTKQHGENFKYADSKTYITDKTLLIAAGSPRDIEKFSS